ncbi:MAG: hypothetical protein ACTSP2_08585, partial [Alphaproteobacteria bacterium]
SEAPVSFDQRDRPFWYTYRAAKAALAVVLQGLAGDMASAARATVCVGLFPGAVDTPFAEGHPSRWDKRGLVSPDTAAARLVRLIDEVSIADAGATVSWDGTRVAMPKLEPAAGTESTAA